jgi:hypothetical protein
MFIDDFKRPSHKSSKKRKLRYVEPKTIYHWVEDNKVTRCYQCGAEFGFFTRKHHCRNCGRIFCYNCSNYEAVLDKIKKHKIIEYIRDITLPEKKNQLQKVCVKCYHKIQNYKQIKPLITILDMIKVLDIKDYFVLACVNKRYNKVALNYFSKFREIQYKLFVDSNYDLVEKNMLLQNSKYFTGHSKWISHFIHSINWNNILKTHELAILKKIQNCLIVSRKKCHCWNLMCTRTCGQKLLMEDTVLLIGCGAFRNATLLDILLAPWKTISEQEFCCYLGVLIQELPNIITRGEISNSKIVQLFLDKSGDSNTLAFQIFWELYLQRDNTQHIAFYDKLANYFFQSLSDEMKENISKQKNLIEYLLLMFQKKYTKRLFLQCESYLKQFKRDCLKMKKKSSNLYKIPIITNPAFECISMNFRGVRIKSSNSKPMIIPCIVRNSEGYKFHYEYMYKQEDLRQEKIIMNTIRLMDLILKREEQLDLYITTYNIIPINLKEGFIEIISSSDTLYGLKQKHFSIQNYIIEKNPGITIEELRKRFVYSCSAYCVISYLLGIGDRHLENIMLTDRGYLFHIDYGYILGSEPKFMAPEIRITPEMVDALGGFDSKYYQTFQAICTRAYNCLRRHANLFIILLSPLYKTSPVINKGIFTKKKLTSQILKRFIPNENYQEAKLKFITQVENSHTSSYKSTFYIDYFHKSKSDIFLFDTNTDTNTRLTDSPELDSTDSSQDSDKKLSPKSPKSPKSPASNNIGNSLVNSFRASLLNLWKDK